MTENSVIIVGSGLSAYGAIRACVDIGVVPTVLDVGTTYQLSPELQRIKAKPPTTWSSSDRELIRGRSSIHHNSSNQQIPKKLIHGSDFFYGQNKPQNPIVCVDQLPPFSFALSGLANGWGAAALPPSVKALNSWEIPHEEFYDACRSVLRDLHYSFEEDLLSSIFSSCTLKGSPLAQSESTKQILQWLTNSHCLNRSTTVFGQARLLVDASKGSENECQYCGECMSGCIYDSIFKPGRYITGLASEGKVRYLRDRTVTSFSEVDDQIYVHGIFANGETWRLSCKNLLLAAGALNTTRIALNSFKASNVSNIRLHTRGSFLLPVFSFRPILKSPDQVNTLPSIFIETLPARFQDWVHIQLGLDNEIFRSFLNSLSSRYRLPSLVQVFLQKHFFVAFVNYDSTNSSYYSLTHQRSNDPYQAGTLYSRYVKRSLSWRKRLSLYSRLFSIFASIKCFPILLFLRGNRSTYHVGSSLPMSQSLSPKNALRCSAHGLLDGTNAIYVVDSASLPWLPGTTLGLTSMAHAFRVATNMLKNSL